MFALDNCIIQNDAMYPTFVLVKKIKSFNERQCFFLVTRDLNYYLDNHNFN